MRILENHYQQYRCDPIVCTHRVDDLVQSGHIIAVPVERFVGQREAVTGHHKRQYDLLAIGSMIVAKASGGQLNVFRRTFEVDAGEIVQGDIELSVEQMCPALTQVLLQGRFESDDLVEAAVKAVFGSEAGIGIEQYIHGSLAEPAFVDAEFASGCAEPVDVEEFHNFGPILRAAVMSQAGGKEVIELEFLEEAASQPAVAVLTGPSDREGTEADLARVRSVRWTNIRVCEETELLALAIFLEDFEGPLPLLDLGGVEFAGLRTRR